MNVRTHLQTHVRIVVAALVLFLVTALALPAGADAGRAARAPGLMSPAIPEHRLEGNLRVQGPTLWLVGDSLVSVDRSTILIEKRGRAEVGAWLIVWGANEQAGRLRARLIEVDRPAGQPAPSFQFTGVLNKQSSGWWLVDEQPVQISAETRLDDQLQPGNLVSVTASKEGPLLLALSVTRIAEDPAAVPAEFAGTVEFIGPENWIVSGTQVSVTLATRIVGQPAVGRRGEVSARVDASGRPIATEIRVSDAPATVMLSALVASIIPQPGGVDLWDMVVLPDEPFSDPIPTLVYADQATLVDESRAVAKNGQWAEVRALALGDNSYHADAIRVEEPHPALMTRRQQASVPSRTSAGFVPVSASTNSTNKNPGTHTWSEPMAIATELPEADHPNIAYTSDGAAHAVWESGGILYHAWQRPGGLWSDPTRVGMGFSPSIRADRNGALHMVFGNQFMGNYEVYYVRLEREAWTLPVNISHTSGYSAQPAIEVTAAGGLHASWSDNTPGFWTIYHADWNAQYWHNAPVPNARGQAPALSTGADGALFLAWQDRVPSGPTTPQAFHVFLSELQDGSWSLPVEISDRPDAESLGPSLTSAGGLADVAWVDQGNEVRYSFGRGASWTVPVTIETASTTARGARILSERNGVLHVAWDEGELVRVATAQEPAHWPVVAVTSAPSEDLRDVTVAAIPGGGIVVCWVQAPEQASVGVYVSLRKSDLAHRSWLPLSVR